MDDAEPLNDAEAEAVLRGLAGPLEWKPTGDTGLFLEGLAGDASYTATPSPYDDVEGWSAIQWTPTFNESERRWHDEPQARAACERHHATGKWE